MQQRRLIRKVLFNFKDRSLVSNPVELPMNTYFFFPHQAGLITERQLAKFVDFLK